MAVAHPLTLHAPSHDRALAHHAALDGARSVQPDLVGAARPEVVLHTPGELEELTNIAAAVTTSIHALTEAWPSSPELQTLVPLPPEVAAALDNFGPLPDGLIRPDFVVDLEGRVRICEVNARFPLNAAFVGTQMAELIESTHPGARATAGWGRYATAITRLLDGERVRIVHAGEAGNDLLLAAGLKRIGSGGPRFDIERSDLSDIDPGQWATALASQNATTLWTELHQSELVDVLGALAELSRRGVALLNDPRFAFIAHDKRLLAAFESPGRLCALTSGMVDAKTAAVACAAVIPTFTASRPSGLHRSELLAKPAGAGKCEGLQFGAELTPSEWREFAEDPDWVIQPVIEQRPVELAGEGGTFTLAGTLPCIGRSSFGPGLYRAFPTPTRGGAFLLSTATSR